MTSIERVPVIQEIQIQYQPPPPVSGGGGFPPQPDLLRPMDRQDPMRRSVPYSENSEADAGGPGPNHGYHIPGMSPISPDREGGGGGGGGYSMSPRGDGGRWNG
jgi:hypothetical protein